MLVRLGSALAAALVLFATATATQEAQAAGRPLVNPTAGVLPGNGQAITRTRIVVPDLAALGAARDSLTNSPAAPQQLEVAFFDDAVFTVNVDRVERLGKGVTNYYGS